ncbi:oxidoreductase [Bradyrhizobium sp. BR 10261]|uniref:oxidoreductase n=1 Tax=Bradyrhizobium sp. BR 10261 TaxID=2749992 RepID=UPI001C651FF9|nr:oxidoreductase [Bradyrhizobium sp. BR 10261]MBW7967589.1 oxidoreductase [Bradyrhizobium sp. BR 10261]
MPILKTAAEIFRRYVLAGVPASGPNPVSKDDVIAWGTFLETMLNGSNGGLAYATLTALTADLAHAANVTAIVYNDTTPAYNGLYIKSGASGSGSWTRIGDLPTSVVPLTVTGGSANAIVASAPETPTAPGKKLFILTPGATNTAATFISVNGAASVEIKNAFGVSLVANSLLINSPVLMIWSVDHYQLVVSASVDASAILSAAQTSETNAAASAAASAATAASLATALAGFTIQPRPQGRLTLTSGVSVTTTDVVAAGTVFYIAGPHITCDGTNILADSAAEASIALDSNNAHTNYHQSGKNFDVFRINDSGTIRIGTGPAWTSDTSRGSGAGTTEVHLFGNTGVWTNANSIVIRFGNASGNTVTVPADKAVLIGTIRMTADGQTEDSAAKRYVYNVYDQVGRVLRNAVETTDNWNYTTASFRQANGNAANQLDLVVGLPGNLLNAEVYGQASSSVGNIFMAVGIGVDSTNTNSAQLMTPATNLTANAKTALLAKYQGYPAIGRHFYAWLEFSTASGTTTFFGDNGNPLEAQSGISGTILM